MRNRILTVLATVAVVATACADDETAAPGQIDDGPTPTATATASPTHAPSPTPTDAPAATPTTPEPGVTPADGFTLTTCTTDRFSIDHPRDWWTNPGDEAPACRMFHPTEQQVQGESLHYAVQAFVDNVEYDHATSEDAYEGEFLQRRETTVDDHRALLIETRSSGRGLAPEGTLQYAYIVDLDGQVLIVQTHSIGETDYERDKALIDRMVDTVRIAAASPSPAAS